MIVKVKVHPSSGKQEIRENGKLEVWLKSKPESGAANRELIELMERHFKKSVRIVKGWKSRMKTLEIMDE